MSLIRQLLESIPEREREMEKEDYSKCTLRAKKGYDRRSGRSIMVFKISRPNKKKQPCGMVDCRVCGVFWRMEMEDLEKRVPGFVSEQVVPKQSLRKRLGTSPAPSTTGSTTSTLTEFTEISEISQELLGHSFDSGIPTPSSTQSSATFCDSSTASIQSTPTKSLRNSNLNGPHDLPSPSSSTTLADLSGDSKLFNGQHLPVHPSVPALNEFNLRSRRSAIFKNSAPSVVGSSSAMSTLTQFSELDTASSLSTPPSSLSSIPLTVSSARTTSTPHSPYKVIKVRKHREMTKFADGSEWIPATLARVQEYIASQGERRLPLSYRLIVARRALGGSRVGAQFEKGIRKVDLKAGVKPQTRAEVLSRGLKYFPNDGFQTQKS
ncbi:hypothetical protein KCU62_g2283, partial [Aureobasidium sp. EXF-3399]